MFRVVQFLKPSDDLSQYRIVGGWRREDQRNCFRHVGILSLPHFDWFGTDPAHPDSASARRRLRPQTSGHLSLDLPPECAHPPNRPSQPGLRGPSSYSPPPNRPTKAPDATRMHGFALASNYRRDVQTVDLGGLFDAPACDMSRPR
ncbi:hypothetical protein SBA4_20059 [Candidatus Sulfopaludibacter sp. SbA4]|nr:hypothetical protein SBA4_20059 [Candidatus Sulfopaludibacter sp. SbA4]